MNSENMYKQESVLTETGTPEKVVSDKPEKKETKKRIKAMRKTPEYRVVQVSQEKNLVIVGRREIVASTYFVVTPWVSLGKVNGVFWTPKEQKPEVPPMIAGFTSSECLLLSPEKDKVYWGKEFPPKDKEMFALFVWTEKFAELFLVTPTTSDPVHILWESDAGPKLLGLCLDVLTVYHPDTRTEFRDFMEEVCLHV